MPECYDRLIVDLDGVVWRGGAPIRENTGALAQLIRRGARVVFLTNNSTRSRRLYAEKLTQVLGARVTPEMVVNSGYSAARWLREHHGCLHVLPVGEQGLVSELEQQCHTALTPGDWRMAEAVVVGLSRHATYSLLAAAHRAITRGAMFVATNSDRSFPVEDGTEPGAGALVAFLEASTGRRPDADTGKPGEWILRLALERLGGGPALVIGDRVDTDMEMAKRHGLPGLLVLTGITRDPPENAWFSIAKDLSGLVRDRAICI